ncbi:GNAT family N-acetyltransferase [Flavobacteriaceae bacterium]|jgi:ElaA protein|nr:GNAT family N-acetyltransferase [Flavobacteriaceae bacterium]|tara:strand:+ start:228 stop:674 length:447 start_codon:yes stop_codon:yes gene_type:complete
MKIEWVKKKWSEVSLEELYSVLRLRSEVFVVEQDCVYQDIDNKDQIAIHLLGYINKELIAYSRLFNEGDYFKETSFGRAIIKKEKRGQGYGDELVKESLKTIKNYYGNKKVKISAQAHLKTFYSKHAFIAKGKEYLEDGIPHVSMESF